MKNWFLSVTVGLASCAMLNSNVVSWEYLSSLGGITISSLYYLNGNWYLPVSCDVSGLNSYSTKPVTINSGIAWVKTRAEVRGNEILIEIETKLADSEKSGSKCGDAYLGKIPPGEYVVFYSSGGNKKVLLGHVTALL